MRKLALMLAIVGIAGCTKGSRATTPSQPAYGQSYQAPAQEPLADQFADGFNGAWDNFVDGMEDTAEAGEYAFHRAKDGAIVAYYRTKRVVGDTGEGIQDATVLTAVKGRLETTSGTMAEGIDVDVNEGVVTLRGHVESRRAAADAVRLALDTRGVDRVVSYLTWH